MKNNYKGESFVAIIVWISILSIVLLWIWNLMMYSRALIEKYQSENNIVILKNNVKNIIRNIDTTSLVEHEVFYLNKNNTLKTFDIFTGSSNSDYKYINRFWENITDPVNYVWSVFSRVLWIEKNIDEDWIESQIIKVNIKKLIKK